MELKTKTPAGRRTTIKLNFAEEAALRRGGRVTKRRGPYIVELQKAPDGVFDALAAGQRGEAWYVTWWFGCFGRF